MRRRHSLSLALALAAVAACSTYGETSTPIADAGVAPPSQQDGGAQDGDDAGGGKLPPAPPPPGCDATADVKDAPACVVNDYGVFVDSNAGDDLNVGTKEKPVRTIANAITKLATSSGLYAKTRVYICEGAYREHVKINATQVSLFGGFTCGTWVYTGNKAVVAPADKGKSLEAKGIQGQSYMSDLAFVAMGATDPGESSIAVAIETSSMRFLRCEFTSGSGQPGVAGVDGMSTTLKSTSSGGLSLSGNPASGPAPGVFKTCTCSNNTLTTGGNGGGGSGGGLAGSPLYTQSFPGNGAGGMGGTSCATGGQGHDGSNAPPPPYTNPVQTTGSIVGSEWVAQPGLDGLAGTPGQGGGGGGSPMPLAGAGGGGCGGCPGLPGKGAKGGGSSIALLSINANLTLAFSNVTSGSGGAGGKGGIAGQGTDGGPGGPGSGGACNGGPGGRGGDGGSGGGGAGGATFGVLYKGPAVAIDGATMSAISIGTPGAKGEGGTKGFNDGPLGDAEKVHAIP